MTARLCGGAVGVAVFGLVRVLDLAMGGLHESRIHACLFPETLISLPPLPYERLGLRRRNDATG